MTDALERDDASADAYRPLPDIETAERLGGYDQLEAALEKLAA